MVGMLIEVLEEEVEVHMSCHGGRGGQHAGDGNGKSYSGHGWSKGREWYVGWECFFATVLHRIKYIWDNSWNAGQCTGQWCPSALGTLREYFDVATTIHYQWEYTTGSWCQDAASAEAFLWRVQKNAGTCCNKHDNLQSWIAFCLAFDIQSNGICHHRRPR